MKIATATGSKPAQDAGFQFERPWASNWPLAVRRRRLGFIGIDIGTRYLKIAQIGSDGTNWSVRAAEIVDLAASPCIEPRLPEDLFERIQHTVKSAKFRGRETVCVLPDGFYERESMEFPVDVRRPAATLVEEHLSEKHPLGQNSRMTDFWTHSTDEAEPPHAEIVSVPMDVVRQLVDQFKRAGLEVHCLDSPPTVAARIGTIACNQPRAGHVAVVDWGDRNATYTLTADGVPLFARTLRQAGLRRLIDAVAAGLQLTSDDTETLLKRYAGQAELQGGPHAKIMNAFTAHTYDVLRDFRDELSRTQSYVKRRFASVSPERLVMLGGGAELRILREAAGESLALEPQVFRAPLLYGRTASEISQPVFANAIALSTLAFAEH